MLTPDLSHAIWRTSTRTMGGESNCVEIATGAVWRKSIRSNGAQGCVEVGAGDMWAAIRDSKDRTGPALTFDAGHFAAFVDVVKTGAFDLD